MGIARPGAVRSCCFASPLPVLLFTGNHDPPPPPPSIKGFVRSRPRLAWSVTGVRGGGTADSRTLRLQITGATATGGPEPAASPGLDIGFKASPQRRGRTGASRRRTRGAGAVEGGQRVAVAPPGLPYDPPRCLPAQVGARWERDGHRQLPEHRAGARLPGGAGGAGPAPPPSCGGAGPGSRRGGRMRAAGARPIVGAG